ncbi:MAG TPA: hypothetical protein VII37_09235, partial [Candidatus Acidoferrum sp.]
MYVTAILVMTQNPCTPQHGPPQRVRTQMIAAQIKKAGPVVVRNRPRNTKLSILLLAHIHFRVDARLDLLQSFKTKL